MYESNDKMVSHPEHYASKNGLEVIDVIAAFTAELSGIEATDTGNIIKYACRWYKKNGIQDLKKIMWYTQHLIDQLEAKEKIETVNLYANGEIVAQIEVPVPKTIDCRDCAYRSENVTEGPHCKKCEEMSGFVSITEKLKPTTCDGCENDQFGYLKPDCISCENLSNYKMKEEK